MPLTGTADWKSISRVPGEMPVNLLIQSLQASSSSSHSISMGWSQRHREAGGDRGGITLLPAQLSKQPCSVCSAPPLSPTHTLLPLHTYTFPPIHSQRSHTHTMPPFLVLHASWPRFPRPGPQPGPPSGDVSRACTNGCGASRPPFPGGPGSRRGGRPGAAHSRWRAEDWALTSGGGGSEEAPLSSITSAAAAAAVAVAAAATTPPQPRRATPGPARRRRRVSTSPSCCCCCGRRCVSCYRRCPHCRRCPVASPRAVPSRRCRSSRYRTDDGYNPADYAAATTAARAAGTSSRRRPSGGAVGRGARARQPAPRTR